MPVEKCVGINMEMSILIVIQNKESRGFRNKKEGNMENSSIILGNKARIEMSLDSKAC